MENTALNHLQYTPIIRFLGQIQQEGLDVGVDTHLDCYNVIKNLPPDHPVEHLPFLLAPLIANSPEEQQQFYELYQKHGWILEEAYFKNSSLKANLEKSGGQQIKEHTSAVLLEKGTQKIGHQPKWNAKQILLPVASLLIIILCLTVFFQSTLKEENNRHSSNTPLTSIQDGAGNEQSQAFPSNIENPAPNPLLEELNTPAVANDVSLQPRADSLKKAPLPLMEEPAYSQLSNRIDNTLGYQLYKNQQTVRWGLVGLLCILLVYWLQREFRKNLKKRKQIPQEAIPENFPLEVKGLEHLNYESEFYHVAKRLNLREETDRKGLDVKKTIQATIRKGGQWDFIFFNHTQPVEYLFLVDQKSLDAQELILFNHIIETLLENDVKAERYYYEKNEDRFWNESYPQGLQIEDLQQHYKDHYLIIFSEVDSFFNALWGDISEYARQFMVWEKRALITPKAPAHWGEQEKVVAENLSLFSADMHGFQDLIGVFEGTSQSKLSPFFHQIKKADKKIDISADNLFLKLEEHYNPEMRAWIAACAIYPKLNWDLTMRMGYILSENQQASLVSYYHIRQLYRLPWFQEGGIPDDIRALLLNHPDLSIEQEIKIRKEISKILQDAPPPENSTAFDQRQLWLATNELFIHKKGKERKKWLKRYQELTEKGAPVDDASNQRLLQRFSKSKEWIPPVATKYVFKNDNPLLGTNPKAKIGAVALLAFLVLFARFYHLPYETVGKMNDMVFSMNTQQNARKFYGAFDAYHFNNGVRAYNSNKFEKAMTSFEQALNYQFMYHRLNKKALKIHKGPIKNTPSIYFSALGLSYLYQGQIGKARKMKEILDDHPQRDRINDMLPNLEHYLKYDFVGAISGRYIRFKEGDLYGYLNLYGNVKIPAQYDYALSFFAEGPYAVVLENGSYFLIDEENKKLTSFKSVEPYQDDNRKWGFQTDGGMPITKAIYDEIATFQNGRAAVKKDFRWGYANQFGELVIPFNYQKAGPFDEESGLAEVEKNRRLFFIDKDGKCKVNCLEEEGKIAVNTEELLPFFDRSKNLVGYKNAQGEVVLPPMFGEAMPFDKAPVARATKNYKWGLIDANGKTVAPFKYVRINHFSDGCFKAFRDGKYGYLNAEGEEITPFIYDAVFDFKDSLGIVKMGSRYGMVNTKGSTILLTQYDQIQILDSDKVRWKKDGKTGLVNKLGRTVDPPEEPKIWEVVEEMPVFPGCDGISKPFRQGCTTEKIHEFIIDNLGYIPSEKKEEFRGKVVVRFVINEDGTVGKIELLRSPEKSLGEEVIRIIELMNSMPERWTPGKQRGQAVKVYYTLPVNFG